MKVALQHPSTTLLSLAAIAFPLATCSSASSPAPTPVSEPVDAVAGFFSAAQADRGRARYGESCRECHSLSEFRGSDFEWKWRRQTAWDLYRDVAETMPEDKPGKLSPGTYADIVAYMLSLNGYQIGGEDLFATKEAMAAIPLGAGVQKTKPKG